MVCVDEEAKRVTFVIQELKTDATLKVVRFLTFADTFQDFFLEGTVIVFTPVFLFERKKKYHYRDSFDTFVQQEPNDIESQPQKILCEICGWEHHLSVKLFSEKF